MAEESAKLRIPYLAASQAQKHVTHNEAMTLLDTLVQLSVLDKDLSAPPAEPAEGDTYIVAGSMGGGTATGAWTGWDARVARFIDGTWRSYLPGQGGGAGWLAYVLDEQLLYRFDGTDWAPAFDTAAAIAAAAAKTTPHDNDLLGLADSQASNVLKKLSWSNLKAALSAIFAVLAGKSGGQTLIGGTGAGDALRLRATAGAGAGAEAIIFQLGNDGATEAARFLGERLLVGSTSAVAMRDETGSLNSHRLQLMGTSGETGIACARFANNNFPVRWIAGKSRNATVGAHTVVQDGDGLFAIIANGSDGNAFQAAGMLRFAVDGAPGAADMPGRLEIWLTNDGTNAPSLKATFKADGGMVMAGASGGSQGAGTINAVGVYDDGALLTSMPLAAEFRARGEVDLAKWDALAPNMVIPDTPIYDEETGEQKGVVKGRVVERKHEAARAFKAMLDAGFDPKKPEHYFAKMEADEVLPGMPTKDEWAARKFSLGEIHSRTWLALDLMALQLKALHEELAAVKAELAEAKGG